MKGRGQPSTLCACLVLVALVFAQLAHASEPLDVKSLAGELAAAQEPGERLALIRGLEGTEDRALIPVLLDQAKTGSPPVAWACLDVLAGLGVPPHEVFTADPGFTRDEHVRYGAAYLKAAGVLLERGDKAYAERIYLKVLEVRPNQEQVLAAMKGLGDTGSRAFVRHALGSMDHPALHGELVDILTEADVERLDAMLAYSFRVPGMTPAQRTSILRVLKAREWEDLEKLLDIAKEDESSDVRVVALELLGKPAAEADLLAVATVGIMWNRADAAAGYLKRAGKRKAQGESEAARKMYEDLAASGGADIDARLAAVKEIETIGSADSLGLLKKLESEPKLKQAAGQAVEIIESGGAAAAKGAGK